MVTNVEVYMNRSSLDFAGNIDGKEFDYTVNEFIALIGAFQKVVAKTQGNDLPDEENVANKIIDSVES